MKSYLTQAGLSLLQSRLSTLPQPPDLSFTGFQIGTQSNFVPDNTMDQAQGEIILDNRSNAQSVKITYVHTHEIVCSAVLDRDSEFFTIGHILFFINDTPTLWLVAPSNVLKFKTNPISHFAGDKLYLSLVFRFPYIKKLISANSTLHANFPVYDKLSDLVVPQHVLADQSVVNTLGSYYAKDKPAIAFRSDGQWLSAPTIDKLNNPSLFTISSGRTTTGV
jgi:hypothetical protein